MKHIKKVISSLIAASLLCGMFSAVPAAAQSVPQAEGITLTEGTYEQGEVIVMFRQGSLEMKDPSLGTLNAARAKDDVSEDFGSSMEATDSETAAAGTVASQEAILKRSLGSDFVIEDTVLFGEATTDDCPDVSLVSSDKYSTEQMIALLSANADIDCVEPNYYTELSSVDYSLNDELSSLSYQLYGQNSKNTESVKQVNSRGYGDNQISINAPTGWKQYKESDPEKQREVVVAILDTGIDDYNEDLTDVIWKNPGNIGLNGECGYDFVTNSPRPVDNDGHGTHCSGIIAAKANNGVGVSGVVGDANVKIMMLKIIGDPGVDRDGNPISASTTFSTIGALSYIKKAKENGVNIVAVNNSWGIKGGRTSGMLDRYFTELGELGILNIIASGNDNINNDVNNYTPTNTTNDYAISVDAANPDGKKANYSNYGFASTDVFAPGSDVLSTVSYRSYLPCIESAEDMPKNTLYYGEFSSLMEPDPEGGIAPILGDDGVDPYTGVNTFGAAYTAVPDGVESSVELADEHWFNDSEHPATLKWTISGLTAVDWQNTPSFYIFFPYEKDKEATAKNSYGSVTCKYVTGSGSYINGQLTVGDVIADEEGNVEINGSGVGAASRTVSMLGSEVEYHLYGKNLGSYEEVEGKQYGFGLRLSLNDYNFDVDEISVYIDSLAVSTTRASELDIPGKSYDIMSGTSMATPVVTGAAALIALNEPGISAPELKNRIFSLVTKTPELADYCSTGGYIDFDNYKKNYPCIREAVVDASDMSDIKIKLLGADFANENGEGKLTVKSLSEATQIIEIGQSESADSPYAVWEDDVVTIHHAEGLAGSYLSFELTASNGASAKGSFFVTKGEGKYTEVIPTTAVDDETFAALNLFSDGKQLYASNDVGDLYIFNEDNRFEEMKPGMVESLLASDLYKKELGLTLFDLYNGKPSITYQILPTYCDGYVYAWFSLTVNSAGYRAIMARFDITSESPHWEFSLCNNDDADLVYNILTENSDFTLRSKVVYNGKIYFISGIKDYRPQSAGDAAENGLSRAVYSFDPADKTFKKEPAMLPEEKGYLYMSFIEWNGCLYGFMGLGELVDEYNSDYAISDDILKFDGEEWSVLPVKMPRTFRNIPVNKLGRNSRTLPALGAVRDGIIISGVSVDGLGDTFLFDGEKLSPIYYSMYDGISDADFRSCAVTREGFYVTTFLLIDTNPGFNLLLLPASSYESPLLGDADGDGKVTVVDATAIQRELASIPVGSFNEKAADVDGDGNVTVSDATYIQSWLAELLSNENIGKPI